MYLIELILAFVVLGYILVFLSHLLWRFFHIKWVIYHGEYHEKSQRYYLSGIALFLVGYFLCRLLLLFYVFTYSESDEAYSIYVFASFFAAIGLFGIMVVVENYIYKELKFIPSTIILICAILMLVFPMYQGTNLVVIYSLVSASMGAVIPLLYLIVGLRISGKTRKKSLLHSLGVIILIIGNGVNTGILVALFPILMYIAPITIIIGLGIFHYALLIYQHD